MTCHFGPLLDVLLLREAGWQPAAKSKAKTWNNPLAQISLWAAQDLEKIEIESNKRMHYHYEAEEVEKRCPANTRQKVKADPCKSQMKWINVLMERKGLVVFSLLIHSHLCVCVCVWKTISEVSIRNLRGILTLLAPRVASRPKTKLLNTFAHSHSLSLSLIIYLLFLLLLSPMWCLLVCVSFYLFSLFYLCWKVNFRHIENI